MDRREDVALDVVSAAGRGAREMSKPYTSQNGQNILEMFDGANSLDRNSVKLLCGSFRATIAALRKYEEDERKRTEKSDQVGLYDRIGRMVTFKS